MPLTLQTIEELEKVTDEALEMSDGCWDVAPYKARAHQDVWSPNRLDSGGYFCIDSPVPVAHGVSSNWIKYLNAAQPSNVKALLSAARWALLNGFKPE